MSDPARVAEQARQRALSAGERAADALARAEDAERRLLDAGYGLERAERAARDAERSADRARASARLTHRQAADLLDERASDLAAAGDDAAAVRAHTLADQARARENQS